MKKRRIMTAAVVGLAAAALAAPAALASTAGSKPVQDCLLPPATCYSPAQ
jgi:hypothetical protein